MSSTPGSLTGADSAYLRNTQYRDARCFRARVDLLTRWGTGPAWYPWVLAQVVWPAGARGLEVGCGPGWLWSDIGVDRDLDLLVSDTSLGMVMAALDEIHLTRVSGLVGDAQSLPLRVGQFDLAVANYVFHHLAIPARGVAEVARTLRPEGVLLAATVGERHLKELSAIRTAVFGPRASDVSATVFGVRNARAILGASFREVNWHAYDEPIICRDPGDVIAFLESTPPLSDAGPRTRSRVERLVHERFDNGDGALRITVDTGVFVCRGPEALSGDV